MNTPGQYLRNMMAAVALMVATPSAQAEKMTDAQRACMQWVLSNPNAADDTKACAAVGQEGDPDKKKILASDSMEAQQLFATLEARMSKPAPYRPVVVKFADVRRALSARPDLLFSLNEMEKTGGMPDVIAVEGDTFVFADVSPESPEGRHNLDYNQAKAMAEAAGYKMMDKATYHRLQASIPLDAKTSSWLLMDSEGLAVSYAPQGNRFGKRVHVGPSWLVPRPAVGFRGLLRVSKI